MITIHTDRTAFIPQADRFIGFENDHQVEERLFYVENEALHDYIFKLDIAESADIVDLTHISDATDGAVLRWDITSAVLGRGGILTTQLRAYDADGTHVWHSEPMEFTVGASVKATQEASDERVITEFEQLEARVEASASAAKAYAEKTEQACDALIPLTDRLTEQTQSLQDNLSLHKENLDNPHAVTASQVGAYTKEETDATVSSLEAKIPTRTADLDNTSNHFIENKALEHGAPNSEDNIVICGNKRVMIMSQQDADMLAAGVENMDNPHVYLFTGATLCGHTLTDVGYPEETTDAANLQSVYDVCDRKIGSIDTALDSILAIQTALLGGESA